MNVIEARGLTKVYGGRAVVRDFTMTVAAGDIYGFVGKNGAGKSTVMKMICGDALPTAGEVVLFESDRASAGAAGAAGPDEGGVRRIGVLIEEPGLLLNLSAYRNLMAKALAWGIVDGPARCEEVLRLVGLSSVGNKKVRGFSLGMKQRLGIAMALLGSPKLLILDEPTNGLDPAGIQEMRSLIASMPQTTGATVLISSHLLGEIEQMVDQVGILNHGKLLFEGSLQQLQKHSRGGILLRVLDAPKAAAVLQQQGVKAAAPADQPDTLQLPPLPDEALAALVCTLAERGVGVVGLTAQTKSLEDIFLSLTQNNGEVA